MGREVVLFASGMVHDAGPLVEAAVRKGRILLALRVHFQWQT